MASRSTSQKRQRSNSDAEARGDEDEEGEIESEAQGDDLEPIRTLYAKLSEEKKGEFRSELQQSEEGTFPLATTPFTYPFSGLVYDKSGHKFSFSSGDHTAEIVPFSGNAINITDTWTIDNIDTITDGCMVGQKLFFPTLWRELDVDMKSFSATRLEFAVHMCNAIMNRTDCPDGMSEMFLQQTVYTAYSALIMAAAPEIILSSYVADQMVRSSMTIKVKDETGYFRIDSKPDAAATIRDMRDAFVVMELKPMEEFCGNAEYQRDYDKCIATTAVTALMLKECGVNQSDIAVPFLIGRGRRASLYVTCFNDGRPVVKQVEGLQAMNVANFPGRRSKMFVGLALLLKGIKQHFTSETLDQLELKYTTRIDNCRLAFSTQKPSRNSDGSSTKNESRERSVPTGGAAVSSVLNLGIFTQITSLPTENQRIRAVFLTPTSDNRSRFYFRAIHADLPVFLKVWNVQSDVEDVGDIKEELKFLKCAQEGSVSVPKPVFDQVLECFADNGERFLLIATEYVEPNQKVSVQDLPLYAAGLIESVKKLHRCGVLHCDIKPHNVLWDSQTKVVKLIDFGHAQQEASARSYRGTKGFTAPEVENGSAHSRQSDSFSVGKTILHVLEKAGGVDDTDKLKELALHLSTRDSGCRLSLDAVSGYLSKAVNVGILSKKPREGTAVSTTKLNNAGCSVGVDPPDGWLSERVQSDR